MTSKALQLWAVKESANDYRDLIKFMLKQYDLAQSGILKSLQKQYVKFKTTDNPQDYYNIMIQSNRLNDLRGEVQASYNKFSRVAGTQIKNASSVALSNTYYRRQYALNWLGHSELKFSILDPRIIDLSVLSTQDSWTAINKRLQNRYLHTGQMARETGSLSELLFNFRTRQSVKVQGALTQGFLQGQGIREQSKALQKIMENSKFQANRIVQTETARTTNLGNQLASIDARDAGLTIMRMWLAQIQLPGTRPNHAVMNNQVAEVDQPFSNGVMRPGAWGVAKDDINEKCTTVDVIVRNGEVQSPSLRRGRNPVTGKNEIMNFEDFEPWAKKFNIKKNKAGQMVVT